MGLGAKRNEPCRCDSGLKYKHCHLEWDEQGISPDRINPDAQPIGVLAGTQVYPLGERPHPERPQMWPIPGGSLTTADPREVLAARLAPFSLDSIVSHVANLSARYAEDRRKFERELRAWGASPQQVFLPFLLRRLVTDAIAIRRLPDTATEDIPDSWLIAAERVSFDIASMQDRAAHDGDKYENESLLMRMLQAQYHDQLGHQSYVRELWLNRRTIAEARNAGLDLEELYRESYGLTYSELAALSFGAYATVTGTAGGPIDMAIWNSGGVLRTSQQSEEAFFRLCARTYAEFQQETQRPELSEAGFEPYALSPLIYAPLIIRDDGTLIAPIARDLLERATRGFTVDALSALGAVDKRKRGIFSDTVGRVYEDYVFKSLQEVLRGTIRPGREVLDPSRLNCDWICDEEEGTTLVEAKSVRLRLKADMTKLRQDLKNELHEKRVGHGLAQLNDSAKRLRASDCVPPNRPLIGLLVIRGELVFLNSWVIREVLEELIQEETGEPVAIPYVLANDEGLNDLTRLLAAGVGLAPFLLEKLADNQAEDLYFTVARKSTSLPDHPLRQEQNREIDELLAEFGIPPGGNQDG